MVKWQSGVRPWRSCHPEADGAPGEGPQASAARAELGADPQSTFLMRKEPGSNLGPTQEYRY